MELGSLITRLSDEGAAGEALQAIGDLVLFARVSEMAGRYGEPPEAYVAASVRSFADSADDEAWIGLVGSIGRSTDPGDAALRRMLEWALSADEARTRQATVRSCCGGGDSCHVPH